MQEHKIVAALFVSMIAVAPAFAQQSPSRSAPQAPAAQPAPADEMKAAIEDRFRELDANADGFISKEEALKMRGLSERFTAADRNKDGKLDRPEFTAALGG